MPYVHRLPNLTADGVPAPATRARSAHTETRLHGARDAAVLSTAPDYRVTPGARPGPEGEARGRRPGSGPEGRSQLPRDPGAARGRGRLRARPGSLSRPLPLHRAGPPRSPEAGLRPLGHLPSETAPCPAAALSAARRAPAAAEPSRQRPLGRPDPPPTSGGVTSAGSVAAARKRAGRSRSEFCAGTLWREVAAALDGRRRFHVLLAAG